ncbi:MAG: lipoprotein-releasing ABC transporter ATP-binding protein LolD [Acidibacter sp.]|jgi:lipoprotein-releasing system ATP-binding protein|nr:lipoprotein-releasing ABC transporter ATP-binding protein LolD [Acidibacter sp.]
MTDQAVLLARGLGRDFNEGSSTLTVLDGLDLAIAKGECIAIVGASGSGKTTLLQILGGLDRPTRGSVAIGGKDIHALDEAARGELRNRTMGFIYQFHHLLPEFSALENVAMPLLIRRVPVAEARRQAEAILEKVGLGERLEHRPHQLSGGERQRAAVARALVTLPLIVFADEPTGNLDGRNAEQVFELMLQLNREHGTSLVIVTHDLRLASRMDRVWLLENGRLKLHDQP